MMVPPPARLGADWSGKATAINPTCGEQLTVAVVNNMPDAALRSTEQQFCRLLNAASHGMLVNVKFYSPPNLARSLPARSHIERYYDNFDDLEHSPPDGLIVTGAEPTNSVLEDDPCWPPISRLVDWAIDCAIPGVWSCLASHVAVRHLDGIARQKLPKKISGLFDCRINRRGHQITHGLPDVWRVPHSRLNGLSEPALTSHGYAILSRSADIGVDIFSRKQGALQLFFQGHPEYDADSILAEYRRDVRRYFSGSANVLPPVPKCYFDADTTSQLLRLSRVAQQDNRAELLPIFDTALTGTRAKNVWLSPASRIYLNWLSYLASRKVASSRPQIASASGGRAYERF